jgi:hypothetical protein
MSRRNANIFSLGSIAQQQQRNAHVSGTECGASGASHKTLDQNLLQ